MRRPLEKKMSSGRANGPAPWSRSSHACSTRATTAWLEALGLRRGRSGYAVVVAMDVSQVVEEFALSEERTPAGTVVLVVRGEADLHSAPELRSRIGDVLDRHLTSMVIDLSAVTFVDSTMLGVLLGALKRMRAADGEMRVVIARREIRRLFEITLLDQVFSLDSTREEALAALEPSPAP